MEENEVKTELVMCDTPKYMRLDMCKNCKRATKDFKEDVEYETFAPTRTLMNGWKCNGYINVNQGSLF